MANQLRNYLHAPLVLEEFTAIEDVKVSRYTMEVSVRGRDENDELVDFLEERGWVYTGRYKPKSTKASDTLYVYTFEL